MSHDTHTPHSRRPGWPQEASWEECLQRMGQESSSEAARGYPKGEADSPLSTVWSPTHHELGSRPHWHGWAHHLRPLPATAGCRRGRGKGQPPREQKGLKGQGMQVRHWPRPPSRLPHCSRKAARVALAEGSPGNLVAKRQVRPGELAEARALPGCPAGDLGAAAPGQPGSTPAGGEGRQSSPLGQRWCSRAVAEPPDRALLHTEALPVDLCGPPLGLAPGHPQPLTAGQLASS